MYYQEERPFSAITNLAVHPNRTSELQVAGAEALGVLIGMMKDAAEDPRTRLAAAEAILDASVTAAGGLARMDFDETLVKDLWREWSSTR